MLFESIFNFLGVFLVLWTIYTWLNNWVGGYRLACTWIGWMVGGLLGASTGIATGGTAFNGTYIFSPIAAWIGFLLAPSIRKNMQWILQDNDEVGVQKSLIQRMRIWHFISENGVPSILVIIGVILLWAIVAYL